MAICKKHKSCIKLLDSKITLINKEKKLNITESRKYIYDVIAGSHKMIKAYEILAIIAKKNPSIKPPTIYRAINFLIENNLVHKINCTNSYIACFNKNLTQMCFFLICKKCKNVTESYNNKLSELLLNTIKKNNFFLKDANLEINGICNNCLLSKNK
jgi:Fur family zinc uptake transcriptional regulator